MRREIYKIAPNVWTPEKANPFTCSGSYGSEWSCVEIFDDNDKRLHYDVHSRASTGIYSLKIGAEYDRLENNLADFIRYESSHGRTVIVSYPNSDDAKELVERALTRTPERTAVRQDDPKWLVHSTPLERWHKIQACGELRSVARLKREGLEYPALGFDQLGEPEDYKEYVVLGHPERLGSEAVVASHAKGYVFTQGDVPYTPGIRLYFDAHRIIKDGLGIRDGMHLLKVQDRLPLDPYMVKTIGVKDVDPESAVAVWTPYTFWRKAIEFFRASCEGGMK